QKAKVSLKAEPSNSAPHKGQTGDAREPWCPTGRLGLALGYAYLAYLLIAYLGSSYAGLPRPRLTDFFLLLSAAITVTRILYVGAAILQRGEDPRYEGDKVMSPSAAELRSDANVFRCRAARLYVDDEATPSIMDIHSNIEQSA